MIAGTLEWMPVPVLVDEVLCRSLSQRAEPLRTIGGHPDEIAGRHWIPTFIQAIDSATLKHKESMLHDVDFHHRQRRTGLIRHDIYRKIEGRIIREQGA